jgi:hypothetical protein
MAVVLTIVAGLQKTPAVSLEVPRCLLSAWCAIQGPRARGVIYTSECGLRARNTKVKASLLMFIQMSRNSQPRSEEAVPKLLEDSL